MWVTTSSELPRRTFLVSALALAASGCSNMRFPVTKAGLDELEEKEDGINVIRVTADNIAEVSHPKRQRITMSGRSAPPASSRYAYRVGQGDQLQITFYADPAGVTESSEFTPQTTAVIDESGQFFFPFVGKVRGVGRTASQIRDDLTTKLEQFFTTPQVEVAVTEFNARRVTITGAVEEPGQKALTNVAVTLLDLINEAGQLPEGDLTRISLRRRGTNYVVNLKAFLNMGKTAHNPILLPGDLIQVPEDEDNKVFTFGEIKVGEIALSDANKTLLEVLAESGGIDRLRADARGIFVFRRPDRSQTGFDVYQFNLSNAAALILAAEFVVAPLDIVFVTNDPATRWADTIGTILKPFDSLIRASTTQQLINDS